MKIGMLWYDASPSLVGLQRAVDYYAQKYGESPTICQVHPSTAAKLAGEIEGLEIRQVKNVLPDHYWLGVE